MRAISIIFRREMGAYLRSPVGWIVAAAFLMVVGTVFQSQALGKQMLSADVLAQFFMFTGIATGVAAVILSFRLIAEERVNHSMVLLNTSPVRDWEIVAGKYLASLVFMLGMLALSVYIPLLIKVNGKVSGAQIVVGYLGVSLFGATCLAIGMFASALARHYLVAALVAALLVIILCVLYPLATRLDPPLQTAFSQLDLWWTHFQLGSFMRGVFNLKDVIFYVAVTYFFLLLSVKTLEAKRWH
jgi:ABC-2 type transport system permease protein